MTPMKSKSSSYSSSSSGGSSRTSSSRTRSSSYSSSRTNSSSRTTSRSSSRPRHNAPHRPPYKPGQRGKYSPSRERKFNRVSKDGFRGTRPDIRSYHRPLKRSPPPTRRSPIRSHHEDHSYSKYRKRYRSSSVNSDHRRNVGLTRRPPSPPGRRRSPYQRTTRRSPARAKDPVNSKINGQKKSLNHLQEPKDTPRSYPKDHKPSIDSKKNQKPDLQQNLDSHIKTTDKQKHEPTLPSTDTNQKPTIPVSSTTTEIVSSNLKQGDSAPVDINYELEPPANSSHVLETVLENTKDVTGLDISNPIIKEQAFEDKQPTTCVSNIETDILQSETIVKEGSEQDTHIEDEPNEPFFDEISDDRCASSTRESTVKEKELDDYKNTNIPDDPLVDSKWTENQVKVPSRAYLEAKIEEPLDNDSYPSEMQILDDRVSINYSDDEPNIISKIDGYNNSERDEPLTTIPNEQNVIKDSRSYINDRISPQNRNDNKESSPVRYSSRYDYKRNRIYRDHSPYPKQNHFYSDKHNSNLHDHPKSTYNRVAQGRNPYHFFMKRGSSPIHDREFDKTNYKSFKNSKYLYPGNNSYQRDVRKHPRAVDVKNFKYQYDNKKRLKKPNSTPLEFDWKHDMFEQLSKEPGKERKGNYLWQSKELMKIQD